MDTKSTCNCMGANFPPVVYVVVHHQKNSEPFLIGIYKEKKIADHIRQMLQALDRNNAVNYITVEMEVL